MPSWLANPGKPAKSPTIKGHKVKKKVKLECIRAKWLTRPALISGFRRIKRLEVFLLPPGWDTSPWQDYPQY